MANLNEKYLRRIIDESVRQVLNEEEAWERDESIKGIAGALLQTLEDWGVNDIQKTMGGIRGRMGSTDIHVDFWTH